MKYVRYLAHGEVAYGVVEGNMARQLTTTPFEPFRVTDHAHPVDHVELLAPCRPGKAMAMALNYRTHLGGQRPPPSRPEPFYKTPNAIIGPGQPIVLPEDAGRVDEEGELVVVIGKLCQRVSQEKALEYVLGYTCGLDISAREWQGGEGRDIQWWRAKSADTFGPIGPLISTEVDPFNFDLSVRINGKEVQRGHASDMIFDIPTIVSFISRYVTLEPGDVIFTGTPGATATIHPGDLVEVEVPGIGVLSNPVVAQRASEGKAGPRMGASR